MIQLVATDAEYGVRWVSPLGALLYLLLIFSVPIIISLILIPSALAGTWASAKVSSMAEAVMTPFRRVSAYMHLHGHAPLHHSGRHA